jgi:hopanoid biosynthesis associated RND transporter like protein HpnN
MVRRHRNYSKHLIERWVSFIQSHSLMVVTITVLITGGILFYSIRNFKINTDLNSMISEKLRFRKLEKDFLRAFPQLTDTIVVVLDADTAERAVSARKRMVERLKETGLFKMIYEPGGEKFFEKNGLLYLSRDELENLADRLADAQPLLAFLSRDLSLRGLFSVLGMALNQTEVKETQDRSISLLFDRMGKTFESVIDNHPYRMSWEGIMFGEKEAAEQRRQFIILQPYLDETRLSADEVSLKTIRHIAEELDINETNGMKMRITGDVALSHENMVAVRNSTGAATLVSLFLVGVVLFIGLGGSGRLVFASLSTLITGLIWTTGFALAFIGSLNLISITFAVLFIGLGIDYSIQFCLRYKELIESGCRHQDCIITTAKGVGRALLLSCITVAIGFYSFLPTAYAGVAELGLISGTGMFISFFANITVLPALLTLLRIRSKKGKILSILPKKKLVMLPYKYSRAIIIGAVIIGLGAATLIPRVFFDFNPLNLYNKESESVITMEELFKSPETQPWTISILVRGEENAKRIAERLRKLKEVKMVVTLSDFVPDDQSEKLSIISGISIFMPPGLSDVAVKHLSYEQRIKALNDFEGTLKKSLLSHSEKDDTSAQRLYARIQQFKTLLKNPVIGNRAFTVLEKDLLSDLPALFKRIETSLQATAFDQTDLPKSLVNQFVSIDGRYRVQVFPSGNIMNVDALKQFVRSVRTIAPDATDAPVTIYESGRSVISSFRQATIYALIAIILFLLIEMRSFYVTALILIPLVLAILLTAAASVLLDIPLNFANVIVVPLLLGVGVHSGIIFVLRYQTEPPADGNMLKTSTARAVLFSILTTIISTSSLSFSPHRGIASMGMLLTICLSFLIICTLVLLPALLDLYKGHFQTNKEV